MKSTLAIALIVGAAGSAHAQYPTVPGIPYSNNTTFSPGPSPPVMHMFNTSPAQPPRQPLYPDGAGGYRNQNNTIQIYPNNCGFYGCK